MRQERGGRRLAVGAGDRDPRHCRSGVGEFDLRDDVLTRRARGDHDGRVRGDAGACHAQVVFAFDVRGAQHHAHPAGLKGSRKFAQRGVVGGVVERHRVDLASRHQFGEVDGHRAATPAEAENQGVSKAAHFAFVPTVPTKYIANPSPARIPVMIQKRTITFVSDQPFISK